LHIWCEKRIFADMKTSKQHHDRYFVRFLDLCIRKFGERFGLSTPQAYKYLRSYKGLDFLIDCYDVEHQLSIDDAINDLTTLCQRHGGALQ
jgi:hypothetical protein